MKATEFLEEWNRTHTASPSYQDVLDWVKTLPLAEELIFAGLNLEE